MKKEFKAKNDLSDFNNPKIKIQNLKDFKGFLACCKDGQEFILSIEKWYKKRSLNQNRFYFGNFLQSQIDCFKENWGEVYDKEQIHNWNKCNIWADELIVGDDVWKMPQSSSSFNTIDWEERLDKCRSFFKDKFNWDLPYPEKQVDIF